MLTMDIGLIDTGRKTFISQVIVSCCCISDQILKLLYSGSNYGDHVCECHYMMMVVVLIRKRGATDATVMQIFQFVLLIKVSHFENQNIVKIYILSFQEPLQT